MKRDDVQIGASEAGAILGVDGFKTPMAVYMKKLGLAEDEETSTAAWVGTHVEHALASMFEEVHQVPLRRHDSVFGIGRWSFMRATPDRVIFHDDMTEDFKRDFGIEPGECLVVEMKTAGLVTNRPAYLLDGEWGAAGSDQIPAKYAIQTQIQTALLSDLLEDLGAGFLRRGIVYALIGGRGPEEFMINMRDEVVKTALARLESFVDDHLVPEIPPPAHTEEDWKAFMEARRTKMLAKEVIQATEADVRLALEYKAAYAAEEKAGAEKARIKALIAERIGARYGLGGDFGRILYTGGTEAPALSKSKFSDEVLELVHRESGSEDPGRRKLSAAILKLAKENTRTRVYKRQIRAYWNDDKKTGADDGAKE